MWRESSIDDLYVYQSNVPAVIRRMRQREDFVQIGQNIDWDHVVFKSRKKTPQSAIRTLGRITRGKVKKDGQSDVFYVESNTIVASKINREVQKQRKIKQ